MEDLIKEMEEYAEAYHIPIARKEFITYVKNIVQTNNFKSILEIGTAIAYTAINLAILNNVYVTTIEYDEEVFNVALNNVKKAKLEDKITLIFDDASNVFLSLKYDLIFIDAAKLKNQFFFEKFSKNLNDNGYIIIDNMNLFDFQKHVSKYRYEVFLKANEELKKYLKNLSSYKVDFLDIGDGIALIKKI